LLDGYFIIGYILIEIWIDFVRFSLVIGIWDWLVWWSWFVRTVLNDKYVVLII